MSNTYPSSDPRSIDPRFAHLPPPPAVTGPHAEPRTGPTPGGIPPAPPRDRRKVELDIRNLLLVLGVLSLVAAATSFVAVNWESFDATMRASLLVGVSVVALSGTFVARGRGLTGTAAALGWLTMVFAWVDLAAIHVAVAPPDGSEVFWALGATALFGLFVALGVVLGGWAMRTGAILAWWTAWWSAFAAWGVTGLDVWILPLAAVVAWFQWYVMADRVEVSSWDRYGVGLVFAVAPAVLVALEDPGLVRPMVVVALALVLVLSGLVWRQLAAVWVGGVSIGVFAAAHIFDAVRDLPGWAVFTIVGVVLLGVGAGFERRLRRDGDDESTPTVQGRPSSTSVVR